MQHRCNFHRNNMLLLILIVSGSSVVAGAADSRLLEPGYGIYLPYTSIFTPGTLGSKLFAEVPKACIARNSDVGKNKVESYIFPKPNYFYRFLEEKVELKGNTALDLNFYKSLLDVSASIDKSLKVMGAGLELTAAKENYILKRDCLSQLSFQEDFLSDLRKLPLNITQPHLESSWVEYDVFLKKFGSHYKTSVVLGKQIGNYVFAKQTPRYEEYYLGVAACSKLKYANLSHCERYSEADYKTINRDTFSENFRVVGGSPTERQQFMLDGANSSTVVNFFRSNTGNDILGYTIEPIWELLKYKFVGSDEFIAALNMLQYFHGFVAQGCRYKEVNGVPVRRFVKVNDRDGVPEYQCQVAATGCREDSDCQLLASSFWSHCYCGGETCIVDASYISAELGRVPDRKPRVVPVGSTFEGENLSCNYNFGAYCSCDKLSRNQWIRAWPTVETDISHDLEMYRALLREQYHRSKAEVVALSSALLLTLSFSL